MESAHAGFLLATLMLVRPVPMTHRHAAPRVTPCSRRISRLQEAKEYDAPDALLRASCPLLQDLYGGESLSVSCSARPPARPIVASQLRCHRSGRDESCGLRVVLLRVLGPVAA